MSIASRSGEVVVSGCGESWSRYGVVANGVVAHFYLTIAGS